MIGCGNKNSVDNLIPEAGLLPETKRNGEARPPDQASSVSGPSELAHCRVVVGRQFSRFHSRLDFRDPSFPSIFMVRPQQTKTH
jgi:hypothetical protein